MVYYHGSPIKDLKELKPFLSEHGKPYIYFATNPLVALLYAVKPVPKPFSFYPYGFDNRGILVYSEYYENAFYDLYKGKAGYLYECDDLESTGKPVKINGVYTAIKPIRIDRVTKITDLYFFYKRQEEKGCFKIKPKNEIADKEMKYILDELRKDMARNDLQNMPQHAMSIFIKKHFSAIWEK